MKRKDAKNIARLRIKEAKSLYATGHYSGAYYLAGYAIEVALKAVIIKRSFNSGDWPDQAFVKRVHTHDLSVLLSSAGLADNLRVDAKVDRLLGAHWSTVEAWEPQARYTLWTRIETKDMIRAVTHPTSGILTWIKRHW